MTQVAGWSIIGLTVALVGCARTPSTAPTNSVLGAWQTKTGTDTNRTIYSFSVNGDYSIQNQHDQSSERSVGKFTLSGPNLEMDQARIYRGTDGQDAPAKWVGTVTWHGDNSITLASGSEIVDLVKLK